MNPQAPIDLPASVLKRYLLARGWRKRDHPNSRIDFYEILGEDGTNYSVVLPYVDEVSNAWNLVFTALETIADAQHQTFDHVKEYLLNWRQDVLKIRILDNISHLTSLPLNVAADTLNRVKQLMGYTAYTEVDPRPVFEKAGGVSSDFSATCRFGHTYKGSFGIQIECPFSYDAPVLPMDDNPPDPPFERKVMERIATGLTSIRLAAAENNPAGLVEGYLDGFGANVLAILADTYEGLAGARVEYDIVWSGQLPPTIDFTWSPVVFEARALYVTREAASELSKVENLPEHKITGNITVLKSDDPPGLDEQQDFEHVITLHWEREKGVRVKIRVPLSPTDYISACDAHKEGRKVRVYGVPEKSGKFWTLQKAHSFTVL